MVYWLEQYCVNQSDLPTYLENVFSGVTSDSTILHLHKQA